MQSVSLPPPVDLERTCRALAALDVALAVDVAARRYTFTRAWREGARLAAMRDPAGDEWLLAFAPGGRALVRAFCLGVPRESPARVWSGLPPALAPLHAAPDFEADLVTFGGFNDGLYWALQGAAEPLQDELQLLTGDARAFQRHAARRFGLEPPLAAVERVLRGAPLDASVLAALGGPRALDAIADELGAIGHG